MTGRIVTFYSYKGGTGRSMALANFAWILAASGKSVLTIDWDLEAPGLHRYFRPFLIDPDLLETDGLIDTFWSFAASAMESAQRRDQGAGDHGMIDETKRRLDWTFPTGGFIDFVGAGRQGATYSERVNTFDWKRFYELGGAAMLNQTKAQLAAKYDWVLIDSRTGVSDTAGICTTQLPDTVVTCFTLNRQSIDGVDAVMRSVRAFRSPTVDGSKIKFFPMATRIENAEKRRLEIARTYARGKLVEFVPEEPPSSRNRSYWDDMEISYRPYYAFEEVLSAFGDATGSTRAADTLLAQMEAMARRISGDGSLQMPEILETDRSQILSRYALGSATTSATTAPVDTKPPDGTTGPLGEAEADTEFLRGLLAKEQRWRKSKFAPEYLLSRRELALLSEGERKQFGKNMAYYLANSQTGQTYFRNLAFVFATDFVLSIGLVVLLSRSLPSELASWAGNDPFRVVTILLALFATGWVGLAVLNAAILVWTGHPPYDVGWRDTFFRLISARISPQIRDYDREDIPPR
jgi:cellulose biosynthesis protein BcsQ